MYFGFGVGVAIGLLTLVPVAVAPRVPTTYAMPLEFPKCSSGGDITSQVHVVLKADGATVLDGIRVADDDAILPRLPRDRDTYLFLDVDPSVPHGRVVHVLDLSLQKGIESFVMGRPDDYAAMRIFAH